MNDSTIFYFSEKLLLDRFYFAEIKFLVTLNEIILRSFYSRARDSISHYGGRLFCPLVAE